MQSLRAPPPSLAAARHRRRAGRALRATAEAAVSAPAPRWTEVQAALNKAGLRSVAVDAVETLLADGFTLVDVRPRADFEAYHAPGSVSVPLFGPIVLDSPAKFAKRLLFAMNGMPGTDENESFVSDVAAAVPSRAKLLVLCDAGGTHRPVGTQLEGRRSRSLIAAYKLITAGFGDVVHVAGGVRGWGESDLALEGTNPEGWGEIQGKMPRS